MERMWGLLACVGLCVQAVMAWSEALPMAQRTSLLVDRKPLFRAEQGERQVSASLFVGVAGKSLFAPTTVPDPTAVVVVPLRAQRPVIELRKLIARVEAGRKDYDAVQYGAKIKPPGAPTALTIREIFDWIDASPGQPHAIGRYQFIPPTLRGLVKRLGIDPDTRFSPRVQDQLADVLLQRAGLHRFLAREIERKAFMNNLAKIWAGLPNETGKSHYDGYAGNKARMTWATFDAQMARIFPG